MLLYHILKSVVNGNYRKSHVQTINLKYLLLCGASFKFELPNESYSVSHLQHYSEYIIKTHALVGLATKTVD